MTHSTHRPGIRALHLLIPLALLAGCSVSDADERSHAGQTQEAEGDVAKWSSSGINDVKGVPMATVSQHLGHDSINTTVSLYVHLDRTSMRAAADAMGQILG